jgi:hypothetical protein
MLCEVTITKKRKSIEKEQIIGRTNNTTVKREPHTPSVADNLHLRVLHTLMHKPE